MGTRLYERIAVLLCLAVVCGMGVSSRGAEDGQAVAARDVGWYADIRITEIMYNPSDGTDFEFLEIKNTGGKPADLSGMMFVDGIEYTFPAGSVLPANGHFVLARNDEAYLARHRASPKGVYSGKLSNKGEKLVLADGAGRVVASVRYNDKMPWPETADGGGYSLVLDNPAGDPDNGLSWAPSNELNGTPGKDDDAHVRVVINEVLAHSDPPLTDAIELYNAGSEPVDIGGWYLSDDPSFLLKFRIMDGMVLKPGRHMVYYEGEFNPDPDDPGCFGIGSHGDRVLLSSADKQGMPMGYRTGVRFGASRVGVSFGRHVRSDGGVDFVPMSRHTFGKDDPKDISVFQTGRGAPNAGPRIGPVVISEIMYHPTDPDGEFIELRNVSDVDVPLFDPGHPANCWTLSNAVDYAFPAGITMKAGSVLLVVSIDPNNFRGLHAIPKDVPVFGPYDGVLNNGGETIALCAPDFPEEDGSVPYVVVDAVTYEDAAPWPVTPDGGGASLEKRDPALYGNDPIHWTAGVDGGTPGRRNSAVLVPKGAFWRYHDRNMALGADWTGLDYPDARWRKGNAPLGHGDTNVVTTVVSDGGDTLRGVTAIYFRTRFFRADGPDLAGTRILRIRCKEGWVAYMNGREILRRRMPEGPISHATKGLPGGTDVYEAAFLKAADCPLVSGVNVLAVEVHRADSMDDRLIMELELVFEPGPAPGSIP